jgi:hypothetical protein
VEIDIPSAIGTPTGVKAHQRSGGATPPGANAAGSDVWFCDSVEPHTHPISKGSEEPWQEFSGSSWRGSVFRI